MKKGLFDACSSYIEERISNAQTAIAEAQGAANAETKSTAGDKHDTARAMMQLEVEKNAKQLAEAQKLKQVMGMIDPEKANDTVDLGAAVETSNGKFYICISAGKIEQDFFAISLASPIGTALKGKTSGESVNFNGRTIEILAIH